MGRSATIPLHVGVAFVFTVTIAASEMPGPVGDVPRSPSTHSVTRRAAGTFTETVLVPPAPLSGCKRYWMVTWQAVFVGLPSVRNSLNPAPARPSAKYHILLTGPVTEGGVGLGGGLAGGL